MAHTVHRYRLKVTDEQHVSMPEGAKILSVARREGQREVVLGVGAHEPIDMWALVDPAARLRPRRLRIVGTGHQLQDVDNLGFLGSVQIADGQLVFHIFEVLDSEAPADD